MTLTKFIHNSQKCFKELNLSIRCAPPLLANTENIHLFYFNTISTGTRAQQLFFGSKFALTPNLSWTVAKLNLFVWLCSLVMRLTQFAQIVPRDFQILILFKIKSPSYCLLLLFYFYPLMKFYANKMNTNTQLSEFNLNFHEKLKKFFKFGSFVYLKLWQ